MPSGGLSNRIGQFWRATTESPLEKAWCCSMAAGSRDGTISENFSVGHDAPRFSLRASMSPFEYYMIGCPHLTGVLPVSYIHVVTNANIKTSHP